MKKYLALVLVLAMLAVCCLTASAEQDAQAVERGEVTLLQAEGRAALLPEGQASEYSLAFSGEDEFEREFTLRVDGRSVSGIACCPSGELYALRLNEPCDGVLLFVPEYGPSDDDYSYAFYYDGERLVDAGGIPAQPREMTVEEQTIHCEVRASVLYTWFREADYILAYDMGYMQYDREPMPPRLVEVPRSVYAMGAQVRTLVDLPVTTRPYGGEVALTIPAGTRVALTATDDAGAVYICALEEVVPEDGGLYWYNGGWIELADPFTVIAGETTLTATDVFDGLFLAD